MGDIRAELEADLEWRQRELRFFQNHGSSLDEQDLLQYRRALILFLYAHLEGFCKLAFSLYVRAVNESGTLCSEASYAIATASLSDVFRALSNPKRKSEYFRRQLPDDSKLHRFAREVEFVERVSEISGRPVSIPDTVVDTESNLKPVVLQKILFRLGFQHDKFDHLRADMDRLLNYRNNIAHGSMRAGIEPKTYDSVKKSVLGIMEEIRLGIIDAIQNRSYLRVPAGGAATGTATP